MVEEYIEESVSWNTTKNFLEASTCATAVALPIQFICGRYRVHSHLTKARLFPCGCSFDARPRVEHCQIVHASHTHGQRKKMTRVEHQTLLVLWISLGVR